VVSVCVPARNEERNLRACVEGLLASRGIDLEVLVYDDQSTDETPRILEALSAADPRVRRVPTKELPSGWNGKQHACWRMAQEARGRWMLFTDADVRFRPDALARSVACADGQGLGMLSTFPRQLTGTLSERLIVPMIFFILFSYLPFPRMRHTKDPAASAGCGQFLLVRKDAYDASGGHQGFKNSMHDGIMMPRAVRRAGFSTDLFDGTELVSCRMYAGLAQVWRGFAKNAYEGLGSVGLLIFLTVMHGLAHVLPWVVMVLALLGLAGVTGLEFTPQERVLAGACVVVSLTQRLVLAWRLQTPFTGAVLHPVGVVLMTAIQWHSFVLAMTGRRSWRGRTATA
jgi:glycosyltransferase involved in cell wall biosynthesis